MAEDRPYTSRQSELPSPGFSFAAKLALLSSPLFASLHHSWRWLTLQGLAELRPDFRLYDTFHYLFVEICFSILTMPVSMLADSTIGLKVTLLCFLVVLCLAPILSCVPSLPGLDSNTRITILTFGANFTGLGIVAFILERAFFVSLMNVNSPTFRLYCFLCYFLSVVWQLVNTLVLYGPKVFPNFYYHHSQTMAWVQLVYQLLQWSFVVIIYAVIARLKRSEVPGGGNSYKVIICIYLAIYYSLKMIWARLRKKRLTYNDAFEACEQWYPKPIVNEMRQTFRLFIVLSCLMYLFGMELILRSIWFYQDEELSRPKSIMTVFPMEFMMLLYLLVIYPFVNYLMLPFIKNNLRFQLSDLRLLGIALIFYNLSYIATMALEWRIMSSSVASPRSTNIAIRIYNCMINPVSWTVEHPELTPATIFLPAQMSRMYVNDIFGTYQIIINSSIIRFNTSLTMDKGRSKVFFMREGTLDAITAMEEQISATPDFHADDSHLFVLNGLINSSKEYLAHKNVEISWRADDDAPKSMKITDDVTHMVLKEATYDITLKLGNITFNMTQETYFHGVYSIMFYDSWGSADEGYELATVSVGFVYSRAWVNVQLILLSFGMAVGQIPSVHYTYKNAPPDMLATCFSFHRTASAMSTFMVYMILNKYGLGPGPSTCSAMLVLIFTVCFIFLSVSDIIPSDDDGSQNKSHADSANDELKESNSGSLKFIRSMLADPVPLQQRKSKTTFQDQESISSTEKEKK